VYLELAGCLAANDPWAGRGAAVQRETAAVS